MQQKAKIDDGSQSFRRKWNREEFKEQARQRIQDISLSDVGFSTSIANKEGTIQTRRIDPTHLIGKSHIVRSSIKSSSPVQTHAINNPVETSSSAVGFYCDVCKVTLNDYGTYLDHLNSWRHQKTAGIKRQDSPTVTVSQVKTLLEELRIKKKALLQPQRHDINYLLKEREDKHLLKKTFKREENERKSRIKENDKTEQNEQFVEMKNAGFDFLHKF